VLVLVLPTLQAPVLVQLVVHVMLVPVPDHGSVLVRSGE
jgi:hypothetical protein